MLESVGLVFAVAAFASGTNSQITFTTEATASPTKQVVPLDPNNPVIGTITINEDTPLLAAADPKAEVVQDLKAGDRAFQIEHDENGFFPVKLASDEKVVGYVDKDKATIICPVQCG